MKTVVLISGQMRSFAVCLPTLHWHLFRKLGEVHFFVSCADDAQAADAHLLEAYYPNVHVERVAQPTIPEPPARLANHAPYAISVPVQSIMRQLWHLNRVWQFFMEKSELMVDGMGVPVGFDVVVRCRPDLFMQRLHLPDLPAPDQAMTPWWGRYGGINDRLAIMGPMAAKAYFTAFERLDDLLKAGCPLHPESIQLAALEAAGCRNSSTLRADFITKRTDQDLAAGKKDDWPVVLPQDHVDYLSAAGL